MCRWPHGFSGGVEDTISKLSVCVLSFSCYVFLCALHVPFTHTYWTWHTTGHFYPANNWNSTKLLALVRARSGLIAGEVWSCNRLEDTGEGPNSTSLGAILGTSPDGLHLKWCTFWRTTSYWRRHGFSLACQRVFQLRISARTSPVLRSRKSSIGIGKSLDATNIYMQRCICRPLISLKS